MEEVSLTLVSDAMGTDLGGASLQQVCSAFTTAVMALMSLWIAFKAAITSLRAGGDVVSTAYRWFRPKPNEVGVLVIQALQGEDGATVSPIKSKIGSGHLVTVENGDCTATLNTSLPVAEQVGVLLSGKDVSPLLNPPAVSVIRKRLESELARAHRESHLATLAKQKNEEQEVIRQLKKLA